jgi:hypothetical protein
LRPPHDDAPRPAAQSPGTALDAIRAAYERTLAAGGARLTISKRLGASDRGPLRALARLLSAALPGAQLTGVGHVDAARRRLVVSRAGHHFVLDGEEAWTGFDELLPIPEPGAMEYGEPLWLLDAVGAATDAGDLGEDPDGRRCALPDGLEAWIGEGGLLRRVRRRRAGATTTLELFDFGAPSPVDWSARPPQLAEAIDATTSAGRE